MARTKGSLNISIVGAGRVGTTLAVLLRRKGYRIASVISRKRASAQRLASLVGCTVSSHRLSDLHPGTRFLLLTTPDEAITPVAREIAKKAPLNFSRLSVAHTSGVLTSDELQPLRRKGATAFSLHPIQSFPGGNSLPEQLRAMKGISYGVEGRAKAIQFASTVVSRLGGRFLYVPKEQKISYHLACVFASNYSVALLGAVEELAKGFAAQPGLQHFQKLIESSVKNTLRTSPQKALTGPIARGSIRVIQRHVDELGRKHPNLRKLYKSMGRIALELALRERAIPLRTVRRLRRIFGE